MDGWWVVSIEVISGRLTGCLYGGYQWTDGGLSLLRLSVDG